MRGKRKRNTKQTISTHSPLCKEKVEIHVRERERETETERQKVIKKESEKDHHTYNITNL